MNRYQQLLAILFITTRLLSLEAASDQISSYFSDITLHIDTCTFSYHKHGLTYNQTQYLTFHYQNEKEAILMRFHEQDEHHVKKISLIPSDDYQLTDTILRKGSYFECKLILQNITTNDFIRLLLQIETASDTATNSTSVIREINLFPYTKTNVQFKPVNKELFIGEVKTFEIYTDQLINIRAQNTWVTTPDYDYRITKTFSQLQLHVLPNTTGTIEIDIPVQTIKPYLTQDKEVTYHLPYIRETFQVKSSRLQFLNIDQREVTLDEEASTKGIEVQIDNTRLLQLNKTYRIENQENPGGHLIGELFTRSNLGNNKVLCWLRLYNYHRSNEGYLYIKEGDQARFITNFSITPKTAIENISILRDGENWSQSKHIYPGETFIVRIEGDGLHKASFQFENLEVKKKDSLTQNENVVEYQLKVPLDIAKKQLSIFNQGKLTSHQFSVKEYQRPRDFDYVYVNYGPRRMRLSGIRGPQIYYPTIRDINFSFLDFQIDSQDRLYGKQYLEIEIQVTDKNNKLMELKNINSLTICPGERSPRHQFYSQHDCDHPNLSINDFLRTKTYEMPEWSRIKITTKHKDSKYSQEIETNEIEIIQGKRYKFDVEVSFPAGLITIYREYDKDEDGNFIRDEAGEKVRKDEYNYGNLGGISMAMIAQFSFYHPDKIAQHRPYKIGAGFIALNAFNFSENANQDLGIVLLGSVYPTKKDVKLSFPLFVGGGYLIKEATPFFMIGPGIRVRL